MYITFSNISRMVSSVEVCSPLVPDAGGPGRPSDHNVLHVVFDLPRKKKFKGLKYLYRKYTEEGDTAFGEWIMNYPWNEVRGSPSEMAEALGTTRDWAMSFFFPLVVRRLHFDQDLGSICISKE